MSTKVCMQYLCIILALQLDSNTASLAPGSRLVASAYLDSPSTKTLILSHPCLLISLSQVCCVVVLSRVEYCRNITVRVSLRSLSFCHLVLRHILSGAVV